LTAYADASFLFSPYVADSNTARALRLIRAAGLPLLATPLIEVELENAIYQRQFRRELTASDCKASVASFRHDLTTIFDLRLFTPEMFRKASSLSSRQTPHLGARALDILHVASALMLGADNFYTFDHTQGKLARAEGMVVRS